MDSCFSSASPSTNFVSSPDLANLASNQADLLEWNGTSWSGSWPGALLSIPPPSNTAGCRAIFIGNATTWTPGGEGFGMRLSSPLLAGQAYSFTFTYVSHGFGSTGSFSPHVSTNTAPSIGAPIGDLPPAGPTWTTDTFSFTATPQQAGHTWLILTTAPDGSSGIIDSFCRNCNDTTLANCAINLGGDRSLCVGETVLLDATTADATYLWQDNSTDPTFSVSEQGTYWVRVTKSNCTAMDSVHIAFNVCLVPLELPNVFTPNQDGQNDLLVPLSTQGIVSMQTTIRNRWGQVVYATDIPSIRWDGHGAPEGTYFWVVSYVDVEGNRKSAEGYVTLLR